MTVKLVVLYTHPADPAAFDQHYLDVHMPLVQAIPGLQRAESGRIDAPLDGGEHSWYRIAELYFADRAALDAAFSSAGGAGHRGRLREDRAARLADVHRDRRTGSTLVDPGPARSTS